MLHRDTSAPPRLTSFLTGSPAAPLVLLHAPAGYGKTTCLASWQVVDHRPFAWLRCGPAHRDRAAFLRAVAGALAEVRPDDRRLRAAVRRRARQPAALQSAILDSLGSVPPPFVLVLDDLHALARPRHRDVRDLIEAIPAGSQVAVATRVRPTLPLARMRAERSIVELGAAELALSATESEAALAELAPRLTQAQRQALAPRIGGWPAGVQLAGLALDSREDLGAAVVAFGGDDRALADYVREEILADLSRDDVELMMQSSLLEEFSGAACDAVLRRSGSARSLRRLARDRSLLVPLDRRDEAFRLVPPLEEMLRSELHLEHPKLETRLRTRAIRWFDERGERDRAMHHAIAGHAVHTAGELMWDAFPEMSGRGEISKVAAWLDALGERQVAASVPLALTAAHCNLVRGKGARAVGWARVAAAGIGRNRAMRTKHRADLLLLEAALGVDGALGMGTKASRAAELYAPDDPWQCAAYLYRGIAALLGGQPERATPLLQEAARRGSIASPLIQASALAQLGMIEVSHGDPAHARDLLAHAHEQIERCGLNGTASAIVAYAVEALARSEEGETQRAFASAQRSQQALDATDELPAWYSAEVALVLARAWLRLEEPGRASAALDVADAALARVPDAATLLQWRDSARRAAAARRGRRLEGDDALTKAELRTLQFLPSHLSFREIGEALCLSPNTVKTQSRAVYRKLGVSSRSAAVERARDAGLLAPPRRGSIRSSEPAEAIPTAQ